MNSNIRWLAELGAVIAALGCSFIIPALVLLVSIPGAAQHGWTDIWVGVIAWYILSNSVVIAYLVHLCMRLTK